MVRTHGRRRGVSYPYDDAGATPTTQDVLGAAWNELHASRAVFATVIGKASPSSTSSAQVTAEMDFDGDDTNDIQLIVFAQGGLGSATRDGLISNFIPPGGQVRVTNDDDNGDNEGDVHYWTL